MSIHPQNTLYQPCLRDEETSSERVCCFAKDTKRRSRSDGFDPICLMSNSLYDAYSKEKRLRACFVPFILPSCLLLLSREIRRGVKSYWAVLGADPGQGNQWDGEAEDDGRIQDESQVSVLGSGTEMRSPCRKRCCCGKAGTRCWI